MGVGINVYLWICLENCYTQDQSYTLSYSANSVYRKKRSSTGESHTNKTEKESLYTQINELQARVFSQQKTLQSMVDKVSVNFFSAVNKIGLVWVSFWSNTSSYFHWEQLRSDGAILYKCG